MNNNLDDIQVNSACAASLAAAYLPTVTRELNRLNLKLGVNEMAAIGASKEALEAAANDTLWSSLAQAIGSGVSGLASLCCTYKLIGTNNKFDALSKDTQSKLDGIEAKLNGPEGINTKLSAEDNKLWVGDRDLDEPKQEGTYARLEEKAKGARDNTNLEGLKKERARLDREREDVNRDYDKGLRQIDLESRIYGQNIPTMATGLSQGGSKIFEGMKERDRMKNQFSTDAEKRTIDTNNQARSSCRDTVHQVLSANLLQALAITARRA